MTKTQFTFYVIATAFTLTCMLVTLAAFAPRLVDFVPILEHANEVIAAVLVLHLIARVLKSCAEG